MPETVQQVVKYVLPQNLVEVSKWYRYDNKWKVVIQVFDNVVGGPEDGKRLWYCKVRFRETEPNIGGWVITCKKKVEEILGDKIVVWSFKVVVDVIKGEWFEVNSEGMGEIKVNCVSIFDWYISR